MERSAENRIISRDRIRENLKKVFWTHRNVCFILFYFWIPSTEVFAFEISIRLEISSDT